MGFHEFSLNVFDKGVAYSSYIVFIHSTYRMTVRNRQQSASMVQYCALLCEESQAYEHRTLFYFCCFLMHRHFIMVNKVVYVKLWQNITV